MAIAARTRAATIYGSESLTGIALLNCAVLSAPGRRLVRTTSYSAFAGLASDTAGPGSRRSICHPIRQGRRGEQSKNGRHGSRPWASLDPFSRLSFDEANDAWATCVKPDRAPFPLEPGIGLSPPDPHWSPRRNSAGRPRIGVGPTGPQPVFVVVAAAAGHPSMEERKLAWGGVTARIANDFVQLHRLR